MRVSKALLAIPLGVMLAGCPGDDRIDDDPFVTEDPIGAPPEMQPAPAVPMTETAQVQPVGDSGVTGEVTISERDTRTEVMVRLAGTAPDATMPGHIHSGTCDNIGGVVQALEPIQTDAGGTGTATVTVDLSAMQVMDGQHVVVYHGAGGAPAACAQIPQHRM
jgi:hypothetical protein